jgi:hypothetical protein
MSSQGGGGQGGYQQRPGQRPQQAAAWGSAPADPYAAYHQQQQAHVAAVAAAAAQNPYGYGAYQMKDGAVGAYAVPQVQGYYVQTAQPGGWDGFGGFGYGAQPGQQYQAAAAGYGQPAGYGLYGSAFQPVYGAQQQQQQQGTYSMAGGMGGAPQRPAAPPSAAVGFKGPAGAAVGSKPAGLPNEVQKTQASGAPAVAASAEDLDIEIEGGFKTLGAANGNGVEKLSNSTSVASDLGKDVYDAAGQQPANKSPFGPGMFFGGIGYDAYARIKEDGIDGNPGAPNEEDAEWKEFEGRFGLDDLLGGMGGAPTTSSEKTISTTTAAAGSVVTSGPPPGLGRAPASIARNGSLGELTANNGTPAENGTSAFQLPSWGTSIGALGGLSDGSYASGHQTDLNAAVQNLAGGFASLGLDAAAEEGSNEDESDREPSPAPESEGAQVVSTPPSEPAGPPEPKKPMSWAAIAKTPAKPVEPKPPAPKPVMTAGGAAVAITANGRAAVGPTASWAAMAKAAGPAAVSGPKRTGPASDDPKSLVAQMFAERGINPKVFNIKPNNVRGLWFEMYWITTDISTFCRPSSSSSSPTPRTTCTNR